MNTSDKNDSGYVENTPFRFLLANKKIFWDQNFIKSHYVARPAMISGRPTQAVEFIARDAEQCATPIRPICFP